MTDRDAQIIKLYQSGLTLAQVGQEIGLTRWPIRDVLAKHNIPIRPQGASHGNKGPNKGKLDYETYQLVWKLHKSGLTNREIAHQLACGEANISQKLKRCRELVSTGAMFNA